MDLVIACASCSKEFNASGDEHFWKCSHCSHEIENKRYPFLTRKLAHAKSHRGEADWESMFDELLSDAREKVIGLEANVRQLTEENRQLKAKKSGP